jgi:tyrosyl-tRNA synthetase
MLGRDIQRAHGVPEQVVLTMPILPGVDGEQKMSKSLGNHIGVTDPPDEMYGRTLSLPDGAMETWFDLLAFERPPAGTSARDAKRRLAREVVARFWGGNAAQAAEGHFDRVFVERQAPEEVAEHVLTDVGPGLVHVPAVVADAFGRSRSEARRLLAGGGVRLDGEPLGPEEVDVPGSRLDGAVLQVGKRGFRRLRLG